MVMIFTKTKVNESMVMDLEGPIHQTHHKFVGATMGARFLGCSSPKRNKEMLGKFVTRKSTLVTKKSMSL